MSGSDRPIADTPVGELGAALASAEPTPGGGAAAAVAAMLAASLTAMVVRLSIGRSKYLEYADLYAEAIAASDTARSRFLDLADEDAAAYAAYRAARRLAHETPAQEEARIVATRGAARLATQVPLEVVRACHAQIDLVERLAGRSNLGVASDLEVAALLLESAARSAAANIGFNLEAVGDEAFAGAVRAELDQRLQQIQTASDRVSERIARGTLRRAEGR